LAGPDEIVGISLRSDEGSHRWAAIDYEAVTRGILVDPKER